MVINRAFLKMNMDMIMSVFMWCHVCYIGVPKPKSNGGHVGMPEPVLWELNILVKCKILFQLIGKWIFVWILCRGLLCDVVQMKMKIFQMSKTRAQSAEEYLKVMTCSFKLYT